MKKKVESESEIDLGFLVKKAKSELHLSDTDILQLPSVKALLNQRKSHKGILIISFLFLVLICLPVTVVWSVRNGNKLGYHFAKMYLRMTDPSMVLEETDCLIPYSEYWSDKFRGPVDCSQCVNVTGVKRVKNLSQKEFLEKYAFSMQPVLVEDAQVNWTASETFNYYYFKKMYSDKEILKQVDEECQFFPYRTKFQGLSDFFKMSKNRVEGKEKPWYCGWSNCVGKVANRLREHYKTPYFLPPHLDHSSTDWIFMGLPGYGAFLHIDSVGTLSWQAQIKGQKKWILQTPPECYGKCIDEMEIIVNPGEIIVLDTNKWFHATEIIGNETSIVIGSEYY